jgi:nucleolar complex protein 2
MQLLLGAARLVPAPAYFPLRLRCARALNRLGEATGTFIPVAPLLLEVLQWGDLRKAPKPGAPQSPDVLLQLRAGKTILRSAQYQEEIISQVKPGEQLLLVLPPLAAMSG